MANSTATEQTVWLTVRQAEEKFQLGKNTGYDMVRGPWAPYAIRIGRGKGSIRLNNSGLDKWALQQQGRN